MKDMPEIDLHVHTTASDGSLAPAEVVAKAKEIGLKAIAITDHDTTAGLQEGLATGKELDLEVVPGCELSVTTELFQGEVHILGFFLPENPARLDQALEEIIDHRHRRNEIIVDKLAGLGLDISYDEVTAVAGEGSVGRPHIARVLQDKGYVNSIQQAFDRYIGPRGKAYAPKKVLTAEQAIGLLKAEGALAVLAHPYMLGQNMNTLEAFLKELMRFGLDGIEAYYSEHSPQQTRTFALAAERLGLAVSGGSDFHGAPKPNIKLGRGKGRLDVPYALLEALKARHAAQAS